MICGIFRFVLFFFFFFQPVSKSVPQGLQQLLLEAEFIIVEVTLNFEYVGCVGHLKFGLQNFV